MPITKEMSKDETFHDLKHGKTRKKTEKKFGKEKADKQMVAIAAKEGKLKGAKGKEKKGTVASKEKKNAKMANRRKRNKGRS